MKKYIVLFLILLSINIYCEEKSKEWAKPIELKEVPNLHKVSDNLFRSGQITEEGVDGLKKLGIKTVINLRTFHSDRDILQNSGINYMHIYEQAWNIEEKDVIDFLKIVNNKDNWPILVHCFHGADRTGTMSAIYRIIYDKWTKEEAIDEMVNGGFGFHSIFSNLITFIKKLDIDKIVKKSSK